MKSSLNGLDPSMKTAFSEMLPVMIKPRNVAHMSTKLFLDLTECSPNDEHTGAAIYDLWMDNLLQSVSQLFQIAKGDWKFSTAFKFNDQLRYESASPNLIVASDDFPFLPGIEDVRSARIRLYNLYLLYDIDKTVPEQISSVIECANLRFGANYQTFLKLMEDAMVNIASDMRYDLLQAASKCPGPFRYYLPAINSMNKLIQEEVSKYWRLYALLDPKGFQKHIQGVLPTTWQDCESFTHSALVGEAFGVSAPVEPEQPAPVSRFVKLRSNVSYRIHNLAERVAP